MSETPKDRSTPTPKTPDPDYEKLVKDCSEEERDVMISNKSLHHAEILYKHILKKANEKICLLTGKCDNQFYEEDNIMELFLSFIKRTNGTGRIEIVCEKQDMCKKFLNSLKKQYKDFKKPESLSLSILDDDSSIINDKDKEKYRVHFMVVDSDGPFRYEKHSLEGAEKEDDEGPVIEAMANFGNKTMSVSLQNFFDKLKAKKATPVNIVDTLHN